MAFYSRSRSDSFSVRSSTSFDSDTDTTSRRKSTSTYRPDLNREDQVASYNLHKWNKQSEYLESKARETEMSVAHRRAAIHILVTEAHRLQQMNKHKKNLDDEDDCCGKLRTQWSAIGKRAVRDVNCIGHQHVIRTLSCMCIFVGGRQAEIYGEHEADRTRRVTQQCELLNKLHVQRLQGSQSCFLATSPTSPTSPTSLSIIDQE